MRLLMIGAPGAGKGTQAEQIATHFGLTHISSGDLFRQHVARKTAIGRVAKAYLQRGDLVPDAVVMDMLYKPVTKANQGAGYVLDGFPRTVEQAEAAYFGRVAKAYLLRGDLVPDAVVMDMLYKPVTKANQGAGYVLDGFPRTVEQAEAAYSVAKDLGVAVQAAVHLEVPTDDLVERLVARGQATGRTDDTEEVIAHRLEVYAEKTTPLLDYYREREQLVTVNGARAIDEVTWSVIVQLQRLQRQLSR